MINVANAVVASAVPVVASFFKLLCNHLLCCRPQLSTLQVLLLQSFDRWPSLKQLKHSLNFCTCSRRSFSLIHLNLLQLQIACCPSFKGKSEVFSFVEPSALDAKALVFGFLRFWSLEFFWANKSSCMKAVDSNQSLKTIKIAVSTRWFCRCRSHNSLSWRESFWLLNSELSPIPGQIEIRFASKRWLCLWSRLKNEQCYWSHRV